MNQNEYNLKIVSGTADIETLKNSIGEILAAVPLCTFATTTPDGAPHITNTFFAYTSKLQIVTLTSPTSGHGVNIRLNSRVEVSIADTTQSPTDQKQGLELVGTMRQASGMESMRAYGAYMKRFMDDFKKGGNHPSMSKMMHSRPFVVDVSLVKVLDEKHLENDTLYVAEVSR